MNDAVKEPLRRGWKEARLIGYPRDASGEKVLRVGQRSEGWTVGGGGQRTFRKDNNSEGLPDEKGPWAGEIEFLGNVVGEAARDI